MCVYVGMHACVRLSPVHTHTHTHTRKPIHTQSSRLQQFSNYYAHRTGRRDPIERIWRNFKYNGIDQPFDQTWRVPYHGVIELDFVMIKKPIGGEVMLHMAFDGFMKTLRDLGDEEEAVRRVRELTRTCLYTCQQVVAILKMIKTPHLR
jgi:hypothetical protein